MLTDSKMKLVGKACTLEVDFSTWLATPGELRIKVVGIREPETQRTES